MKTNVTDSSLAAYDHIKGRIMAESYKAILAAMVPGILYTRKQIARQLNMETSSVSGRVNELIALNEIQVVGQIRCPISERMVEAITLAPLQAGLFE